MLKEISIEITRKCVANCIHCSSSSNDKCSEILEYDKVISVVKDAADMKARIICLSGGEPFLHPRILDIIMYINSLNLQSFVYTNGIIVNSKNEKCSLNKDILQAISGKVTKLIFNIEAATSSSYDNIMGTDGCFEIMKQSVLNANSFSIATEAHFVPMKLNFNEITDVIALCKKLGILKISFLRLVLHGRALQNEQKIRLSDDEFLQLKNLLKTLQKEAGVNIRIGVPLSSDYLCHNCEAATGKLNIKYDGIVYPCEVFKNDRIANELEGLKPDSILEKSLNDIYNNSKYLQKVRELLRNFSCEKSHENCIGQYLINNRMNQL